MEDLPSKKEIIDKLVELYSVTQDPKQAGFILPDGRLLDLKRQSSKSIMHWSSVARALEALGVNIHQDVDPVFTAMISIPLIRMDIGSAIGLEFFDRPTRGQIEALEDIVISTELTTIYADFFIPPKQRRYKDYSVLDLDKVIRDAKAFFTGSSPRILAELFEAVADALVVGWVFSGTMVAISIDNGLKKRILQRLGLPETTTPKEIGSGSFGIALDLGNQKVLKVTMDASEASSSAKLVGKQTETICPIYDVFKFAGEGYGPSSPTGMIETIYGIVMPLLKPPDKEMQALARAWFDWRNGWRPLFEVEGQDFTEAPDGFKTFITPENVRLFTQGPEQVPWSGKWEKRVAWLMKLAEELQHYGIEFYDLHPENIMKTSDGRTVVIDLGQSQVPVSQEIPTVSMKKR